MIEYLLSLSLLIAAVLLIRGIFRKTVSPRAIYALWLVVVIRMLLPISLFEVDVTLPEFLQTQQAEETAPTMPSQSTLPTAPEYPTVLTPIIPTTPITPAFPEDTTSAVPVTPITPVTPPNEVTESEEPTPELPKEPVPIHWKRIADLVWLCGAVIAAAWVLLTTVTYNSRLYKDRRYHRTVRGTKVYISDGAGVPCIAGLIPSIYITPEAARSKSEILIIIHEHVHIRHGDHIWSIIRALALIVFWWNPLVWVAATVSKQDAELACDDAISSKMNDEGRLKYANILIDTIPQKHRYAVGLGSAPMKERILMLTKKQKNRWISLILAIVLAVSAVGCSFVSLNEKTGEDSSNDKIGIITENLSDFLTEEQIALYEKAGVIYPLFNGNSDSINILHLLLEGASFEAQTEYIVANQNTADDSYKIDNITYRPSYGEYDTFDEFKALCVSVFTEDYFEQLNAADPYSSFIDHNGKLYNIDAARGGAFGYAPDEFPDEYEVVEMSDDVIVFTVTGHYKSSNVKPIFTLTKEAFTVKMVLTESGWRFAKFADAGLDDGEYIGESEGVKQPNLSGYLEIPEIKINPVKELPYSEDTVHFSASPVGGNPKIFFFDDSLTFWFRNYLSVDMDTEYYTGTLTLPDGFSDGRVVHVTSGAGSGEIFVSIEAIFNDQKKYLTYGFFGMEAPTGVDVLDEVQTKRLMEELEQMPVDQKHHYTSDIDNYIPPEANSLPEVTVLTTGKVLLTYETEEKLPLVYFGQGVDAETMRVTKTEFEAPDFSYTDFEVIDYLYESGNNMYATVRFTLPDGTQNDVLYSGYMGEYPYIEDYEYEYKWRNIRTEPANEINRARGQYDPAQQAELIPNQNAQVLFWLKTQSRCYYFCSIRTLNSAGNAYTDDPPKDFVIYYQQYDQNYFSVIDEPIPEEYPYDSIVPVLAITGEECISMRCILQLTDGDRTYYISYQSYPGIDQVYHPVSDDEAKMLANIYPDIFGEISEETPMTEYTETDEQTGYELSFVIPESWNHNADGILYDENGNKRVDAFSFHSNYPFDSFRNDIREIANGKLHNLDYAITGTNQANISYIGYHVSVNPIGEAGPSNYYFCLIYNDEARFYINIYGENIDNYHMFYDEYVLPIIQSVTIRETGDDVDTITDIADWDKLPWSESWERWSEGRKPASNAYNFIYNLVSGESEIPEYNGLGIKDYSITLVEDEGSGIGTTLSFTFTVTGNSLPQTLLPGTYIWTIHDGMSLLVYTEGLPTNYEEGTAYENRMRGLDRFVGNSAVEAVNTYLSWMPYIYEVSPYGEWDMTNPHLPYNYICAYYGKSLEIGFSELQSLMAEKFGIAVERPEEGALPDRWLNRCAYDKDRDIVYYADTRGYEPVHRIIDFNAVDGTAYVTVQLFADRHYLIPSHKVLFRIGADEVFLGCEIIQKGNYEPRELS